MLHHLTKARARVFALRPFSVMALGAMAMASLANAEGLTLEAKTFTEPVEEKLGPAIPVVVGFLAAVFAIGWLIRWIMKRANHAK